MSKSVPTRVPITVKSGYRPEHDLGSPLVDKVYRRRVHDRDHHYGGQHEEEAPWRTRLLDFLCALPPSLLVHLALPSTPRAWPIDRALALSFTSGPLGLLHAADRPARASASPFRRGHLTACGEPSSAGRICG